MAVARLPHARGRALLVALPTVFAAMVTFATPARALASGACDLHTLRGSYIFAASGFNIVSGAAQPKAIVEVIEFGGDGTLAVPAATVSLNGTVTSSQNGSGTYALGTACRGTLTFSSGPTYHIFTDRKGKQIWMIQTNPNTVFQGTITRVSTLADEAEEEAAEDAEAER